MCGFAGFLDRGLVLPCADWPNVLDSMGNTLRHRGPDDGGKWTDPRAGLGVVHRRLAVLDLSPAGHQPMVSDSGRFVLVFNGEIYNHADLRGRLEPRAWRGHSDTETLLALFENWSIEAVLGAVVGMFAFALWDRAERRLTLARDRMGEKPLYYGWQRGVFLFGSELKAIRVHPAFEGEVNRDALTLLLRNNAIGAPHSIFRNIYKLPPGSYLGIGAADGPGGAADPVPYWSLARVARRGIEDPLEASPEEVVDTLEEVLLRAVDSQRVADVPVGVFLSGGIDSSTVAALMQSRSPRPIQTFSIGFHEKGYDEAEYAGAVARHLGVEHTDLYVTPRQALDVIPQIPEIWDEPFSDSSQIPTYILSGLARRKVTVALSGDGGDELFGGYSRYGQTQRLWRKVRLVPAAIRLLLARAIRSFDLGWWDVLAGYLPKRLAGAIHRDRLLTVSSLITAGSGGEFYSRIVTHWKDPSNVVLRARDPGVGRSSSRMDLLSLMMLQDGLDYLPNDILTKVDRAAMAVSLETRMPILDHRVVEFSWRIPRPLLTHDGKGKWPLRQVLYRYVPRALVDRPKMGFGVPIDSWLRGPLRDWGEELLSEERLNREGFFDPRPIRRKWLEHQSGRRDWHYYLWDVLMFQAWWASLQRTRPGLAQRAR
jgi:asparagine synthase (glutamine-hydrolysing)